MSYEVFTRTMVRRGDPSVTVTKYGRISINMAASHYLDKDKCDIALLLWDGENYKFAVKPIKKSDTRAYRLHYYEKGNGIAMHAKTFLDYIQYDYTKTRAFTTEWNTEEAMLEVEIPKKYFKKVGVSLKPGDAGD